MFRIKKILGLFLFGIALLGCRSVTPSRIHYLPTPKLTASKPALAAVPIHSAASTLMLAPDTNSPTVTNFVVQQACIGDFTNRVYFQYQIVRDGYWTDPIGGGSAAKIFDVTFPAQSNSFYTAWYTGALDTNWIEYPTPTNMHPARANQTFGLYFPVLGSNRFYQIRGFVGGDRVTWR